MGREMFDPETFIEVAQRIQDGKEVYEGADEDGFVLKGYRQAFVGCRESENAFMVAKITKSTKTIGRGDPEQRTREHTTTQAEFKRLEFDSESEETDLELDMDTVEEKFKQESLIDTGYINPYRVTPLPEVVDEIFKWYNLDE